MAAVAWLAKEVSPEEVGRNWCREYGIAPLRIPAGESGPTRRPERWAFRPGDLPRELQRVDWSFSEAGAYREIGQLIRRLYEVATCNL